MHAHMHARMHTHAHAHTNVCEEFMNTHTVYSHKTLQTRQLFNATFLVTAKQLHSTPSDITFTTTSTQQKTP